MIFPFITAIAPPSGGVGIGLTLIQLLAVLTVYKIERTSPTEYSKFATIKEGTMSYPISSKLGMLIIYAPATLVTSLFSFVNWFPSSLVAPLLFMHFCKRTVEVLVLHKYSGQVEAKAAYSIGTLYVLYAALISSVAVPIGANDSGWCAFGYAMFAVGIFGNLYHHYLLAMLRKDLSNTSDAKRYKPPSGGLFCLVATPHYFFELVMWLGIACVAQQTNAFLVFLAMCGYLLARAENTNEYYFAKFTAEDWPRSRRAIIPFV